MRRGAGAAPPALSGSARSGSLRPRPPAEDDPLGGEGRRVTKHFWLARMVARITSGGMARKASSKRPHQGHGPFDQPRHLLQQPLVLHELQAAGEGEVAGVVEDHVLAPVGVEHHAGALQRGGVVGEVLGPDRAGREEAVAEGDVAGRDAVDGEAHHVRVLALRPEGAQDRVERAHPAQGAGLAPRRAPQRIDFGQGKARMIGGRISARTSVVAPARALDRGDVELALRRGLDPRLVERRKPGAAQETLDRGVRRADARARAAPRARSCPSAAARRRAASRRRGVA